MACKTINAQRKSFFSLSIPFSFYTRENCSILKVIANLLHLMVSLTFSKINKMKSYFLFLNWILVLRESTRRYATSSHLNLFLKAFKGEKINRKIVTPFLTFLSWEIKLSNIWYIKQLYILISPSYFTVELKYV